MNTQKNKRSIEDMVDNFYVVYRKAVSLFFSSETIENQTVNQKMPYSENRLIFKGRA